MKDTLRSLTVIASLALLSLLYVHEQLALFRVSYRIEGALETLAQKSEEYRKIKFEVDQLKAPRPLEEKMKLLHLDLALPKEVRVVTLPPASLLAEGPQIQDISFQPFSEGFLDFLGRWIKVAQAKTEQ